MTDPKKHLVPNADTHNQGEGDPGGGTPGDDDQDSGGKPAGGTQGHNPRADDLDGNRMAQPDGKRADSRKPGDGNG